MNLSPEIIAELKTLQITTKKLVTASISGQYRSVFKGRGIEFEDLKNYQAGDDVRTIDWKVTARSQHPYIRTYREERELNVVVAVDISGSTSTGLQDKLKKDLIAQVGASLALIALNNNDKIGLVTFSDKIEQYLPPRKARSAVWQIGQKVLAPHQVQTQAQTKLEIVFNFLAKVLKQRAIIFVISDFLDSGYEKSLVHLTKKHDLTTIVVETPIDLIPVPSSSSKVVKSDSNLLNQFLNTMPEVKHALSYTLAQAKKHPTYNSFQPALNSTLNSLRSTSLKIPNSKSSLINVVDPESGAEYTLDFSDKAFRESYLQAYQQNKQLLHELFSRNKINVIELRTDEPFMPKLKAYFNSKLKQQHP
ncbi:MAG: DUF58 domain-containing protein [Deltaproteobacteria bacterium]|jgi:uncharacterized protein (DUF58 family)|nr:DUF58 domain-containing protein [Deltaproteobacteria bacterium]